ncbi:MAG: hypothetical protein ABEJ56_02065 [Candidatus Nanohaloarchaea archaeon]
MSEIIALVTFLVGFVSVFMGVPYARKYLLSSGIYGKDQQKPGKPKLPTSGGLVVLFGFMFAVTAFLGLNNILDLVAIQTEMVLAALSSAIMIALIGLVDDIHVGEKEFEIETPTDRILGAIDVFDGDVRLREDEMDRIGLSQFNKMLFVLPAVFPLMAVGAGSYTMKLPFLGMIDWGLVYPLVLLPLGLLFVANVVNFLAGLNGLSPGTSLAASLGLGIFAFLNSKPEAMIVAFSLSGALAAFLYYNWYPASILPGDSLTYLSGAAMFSAIVLGDMEKFGVFIFIPWIIEFFLKTRSGFKAHSWGVVAEQGLLPQHERTYSLTHPLMRKGFNEKEITSILVLFEVFVVAAGLFLFQTGYL